MNTEQIRDIAIKRHDKDADGFQAAYASNGGASVFKYGRNMIIEELEIMLNKLPVGSKVLDVGCGTAHLTKWIKDKGFDVYGVEPSEKMYAHAVKNFPDIEIKKAVSTNIPYPGGYFDLVIAIEVLRYLDKHDNAATYSEFKRVLKPNGQFFVTQVNLFCTDMYFLFHHAKGLWRKLNKHPHPHCNFTTYLRQKQNALQAGFTDISTIGRMEGSIRIFYKFGDKIGKLYSRLIEKLSGQRNVISRAKLFNGHLIVIGKKK